jgi:hypothetical protein
VVEFNCDLEKYLEIKMDDYLSKPNKQPVLKTILKHWLPKTFSASQPDPKELKREEIKLYNFWCHNTNKTMSKA